MNYKRIGEEMLAKGEEVVSHSGAQDWTNEVLQTLRDHATVELAEAFLDGGQGRGNIVERMPWRIGVIQNILNNLHE